MEEILQPGNVKPKRSKEEYTIPFDIVPLPSKGLIYKDGPLAGMEAVEVHYLTAIQEDILTSPNLLQSRIMLDTLLSSVLKDKTIDPTQLSLGDRNAIVIWLRSTGYGAEYPIRVQCQKCPKEFTHEFDLGALESRILEVEPNEQGYFSFLMPVTKKEVLFRFLTSEDELTILRKVEAAQDQQGSQIDNTVSLKMMTSIVSLDGDTNPFAIKSFVESLPVKDARAFREYVNKIEPGIMMVQDCPCPGCGNVSQEVIPIRRNFFWPDSGA